MANNIRVAFFGSPPFANLTLETLIRSGRPPSVIVTAPLRRAGRGRRVADNFIAELGKESGIPVLQPRSAKDLDFQEELKSYDCDLMCVVSYGQILNDKLINLTRLGCVNIHASLLPRWRGASPIQATILSGDLKSGVTIQKMVLELDAGDVLYSKELLLPDDVTAPWLFKKLSYMGAESFLDFIKKVETTNMLPPGEAQNPLEVTHCQKIQKLDGEIDWQQEILEVDKHYRAYLGWPGAFTYLPSGERLIIHQAKPLLVNDIFCAPGEIFLGENKEVFIACGMGALELVLIQREGRKKAEALTLISSSVVKEGDCLGASCYEK